MERQAVLDGAAPPELGLVLSEGALRVQVGGPDVMRAQLRKLAEVAGHGQVTLQVLPASAAAHVRRSARSPSSTSPTPLTRRWCTPST